MDKFIFRFNTILHNKERIEDDRKNKLGISMRKLVTEQQNLENLFNKKENIMGQIKNKTKETVKVSELRRLANNMEIMKNIIDKQQHVVDQSKLDTENKRINLLEASKQKKVFEKLKEKDFEEHKYLQLKKEDAIVDQFVSYKAANK